MGPMGFDSVLIPVYTKNHLKTRFFQAQAETATTAKQVHYKRSFTFFGKLPNLLKVASIRVGTQRGPRSPGHFDSVSAPTHRAAFKELAVANLPVTQVDWIGHRQQSGLVAWQTFVARSKSA
jgi:hypothetical protein